MNDDDKTQVKAIAAVLAGVVPQAARVSLALAGQLYEHGLRLHPELSKQAPQPTPTQQAWSPAVVAAAEERAWKLVREMAEQYPHLRPFLRRVENAKTVEEKRELAAELREQIQPEVLAAAQTRFMEEFGDNTE